MRRLHITNGDSAADIIRQSTVPGDVLPWRDPMHHGPFPADLGLDELSQLRARYLAGPDRDPAETERDFRSRDAHLEASATYESIVLWFEHDLLDQLQILQILDWFSRAELPDTSLELICIDRFPGMPRFRGIGELDTEQMASLFTLRAPVTKDTLALAATGWAAFRSDDPRDLVAYLNADLETLPFLPAALSRHLEEYPSAASGLSRTESQLLSLAGQCVGNPGALFVRNMELETALFMGDWPTYRMLDALCQGGLLACDPPPFQFPPLSSIGRDAFDNQRLVPTEAGKSVLDGRHDAFGQMIRDCWLGGVHLQSDGPLWTWDAQTTRLVRREI